MTTEQRAMALLNGVLEERDSEDRYSLINRNMTTHEALCRAIEQHEAFQQEVSDALVWYFGSKEGCVSDALRDFIIPAPNPDPLADAVESVLSGFEGRKHAESYANQIRAALEARGLEIRSKNDG